MSRTYAKEDLDAVFGTGSSGSTPTERAANSTVRFVRSQLQLASFSAQAKGRVLAPKEALDTFGWEVLRTVGLEHSAPLLRTAQEPSSTLRRRREELGLTATAVAHSAGVSGEDIRRAETAGVPSPIRVLEKLAQALALDERRLGIEPGAGADKDLGVRLRQMSGDDVSSFSSATVLQLTEAAWVVARQHELDAKLVSAEATPLPKHDSRYGFPTWKIGYELAQRTRELLHIGYEEPIKSVRHVIESRFRIPLVQEQINQRFAGATIANGTARGIVVNEEGPNRNVWVRRMTMAHELGHLLWDPDERLQSIKVDKYADLEEPANLRDEAEIRANAFAVSFLAPPSAIHKIAQSAPDLQGAVIEVMTRFGISATAARNHIQNVQASSALPAGFRAPAAIEPDTHWIVAENLTLDYFPIQTTPLSRRGLFAQHVAKLCLGKAISLDTAATYLKAPVDNLEERLRAVAALSDGR
jgi:Zn-dependent peptidase ImmA (M78 family)/transcriptional regulator with XRE-family HTH domain